MTVNILFYENMAVCIDMPVDIICSFSAFIAYKTKCIETLFSCTFVKDFLSLCK